MRLLCTRQADGIEEFVAETNLTLLQPYGVVSRAAEVQWPGPEPLPSVTPLNPPTKGTNLFVTQLA